MLCCFHYPDSKRKDRARGAKFECPGWKPPFNGRGRGGSESRRGGPVQGKVPLGPGPQAAVAETLRLQQAAASSVLSVKVWTAAETLHCKSGTRHSGLKASRLSLTRKRLQVQVSSRWQARPRRQPRAGPDSARDSALGLGVTVTMPGSDSRRLPAGLLDPPARLRLPGPARGPGSGA